MTRHVWSNIQWNSETISRQCRKTFLPYNLDTRYKKVDDMPVWYFSSCGILSRQMWRIWLKLSDYFDSYSINSFENNLFHLSWHFWWSERTFFNKNSIAQSFTAHLYFMLSILKWCIFWLFVSMELPIKHDQEDFHLPYFTNRNSKVFVNILYWHI